MTFGKTLLKLFCLATLFVFFSAALSSCFEPEGENFVPVSSPTFEDVDVTLSDNVSELYIYRPSRVTYQIDQGNFQLTKLDAFLDEKSLKSSVDPSTFLIDPALFSHGYHTLQMKATFTSFSSGTLASSLGKETKTIERSFPVMIDRESPEAVSIANVEARDGTLYISWDKPEKENFINYKIRRFVNQSGNWVEPYSPKEWIVEPYKTEVRDSVYTGGEVRYRVDILGYGFSTAGEPEDANFPTITPVIETLGDNTIKVSWATSLFYNNIDQIRLGTYNVPDQYFQPDQPASFTRNVPLGASVLYYATPSLKYSQGYVPVSTTYFTIFAGQQLKVNNTLSDQYIAYQRFGSRELLISKWNKPPVAILFNSTTGAVEKSIDLTSYYTSAQYEWPASFSTFSMTPDGNSFFLFTGAEVYRFDSQLNLVEQLALPNIYPPYFFAYNIRFSNSNVAAFNFYAGTIRVVDFENNVTIASLPDSGYPFNISPDGKYFFYDKRLFDISSGAMVELASFPTTRSLREVMFSHQSDKAFISYYDGHFAVVDLASKTIISEHDFPGTISGKITQDPITGLCGVVVNSAKTEMFVFDPTDYSIVRKVEVAAECFLYNNTLYAESRYALPL